MYYLQNSYLDIEGRRRFPVRDRRALQETRTCRDENMDPRCCRYHLEINFASFGWNWIIHPPTYDAYYCSGTCPLSYLPATYHAHIQHIAGVMPVMPCCAATKVKVMDMLYEDGNHEFKHGKVPGMIVEQCGCA